MYNVHNLQFLLLQLHKLWENRGFFLFIKRILSRLAGSFNETTVFVSQKISLIDSFALCLSFWLTDLMFRIPKFE